MAVPGQAGSQPLLASSSSFLTESELLAASSSFENALAKLGIELDPPPRQASVVLIGAGLFGISLSAAFLSSGPVSMAVLEKRSVVAGLHARYGSS